MTIKRIYSGLATGQQINRTEEITGATAIFLLAPDISDEIVIDFNLQFPVSATQNKLIILNENNTLDSFFVYPIPSEYQEADKLYGAFLTTENINIEIYAFFPEISLKTIKEQIEEIRETQKQRVIIDSLEIGNELAQNTALIALSSALIPITGGLSTTALPPLTAGSSLLLPFL